MMILDDFRTAQDRQRRAARQAARIAAGLTPTQPRRVGSLPKKARPRHRPTLPIDPGCCHCGCGDMPRGKRSRFLPGHDSKLRGQVD